MNKRIIILAAGIAALAGLGFWAHQCFEIYDKTVEVPLSSKVSHNNYYALEHWLAETGHPVRIETQTSAALIAAVPEKTVLVQASLCDWKDAQKILSPWIRQGGFLLISLDEEVYDDDLKELLVSFGIWADYFLPKDDADKPALQNEKPVKKTEMPSLDWNVEFFVARGTNAFAISPEGKTRLVQASLGKGMLTVTGSPFFMFNSNLDKKINARLAWNLTGAQTPENNPRLLFVRGRRPTKGLLGKFADWGNVLPPAVSALLLIVLGFWMVIPRFGKTRSETQSSARPIRERFLAETRFLKKYCALYYYVQIYERELKIENPDQSKEYQDIINRLKNLQTITEKE